MQLKERDTVTLPSPALSRPLHYKLEALLDHTIPSDHLSQNFKSHYCYPKEISNEVGHGNQ